METLKLVWTARQLDNDTFMAQIIERDSWRTLYNFYIPIDKIELFTKIMATDTVSVQYLQNFDDSLRDAAIIKVKLSPHNKIPKLTDNEVWERGESFYLDS